MKQTENEIFEKKLKKIKGKSKSKKDIAEFVKKNVVPKPEKDYNLKIRFTETNKTINHIFM